MEQARWYLLIGGLLILLVGTSALLKRLPVSTAMVYLLVGWGVGSLGWLGPSPQDDGRSLELLAELALLISLFTAGLKLRKPLRSPLWRLPAMLATGSMIVTVGIVAACAALALGLPWGAAIILGAVLAPTDPVLAAEVEVEHANDTDRLRFTLTGEAGLNDGTAFPFVMLGLGLLGLHELGASGLRWAAVDVVWATLAGLTVGALIGQAVGRLVTYLRAAHRTAVGYDDFLALGVMAAAYGAALTVHAYGFLAVFAAGVALRSVERETSGDPAKTEVTSVAAAEKEMASHPQRGPAYMTAAMLHFNEQMERLAELTIMLATGALLASIDVRPAALAFALLLLFIVRPLAAGPVCLASGMTFRQALLTSWFGIRGVGSLYYLFFALNYGLPDDIGRTLAETTLCVVAVSVVLHGFSVTPLMRRYERAGEAGKR